MAPSADFSFTREVLDPSKSSKLILTEKSLASGEVGHLLQSKEVAEILTWFEPVGPALKHQEFRREYLEGTGYWIFDTPEYINWANTEDSNLWIHGIPGAGKTIFAYVVGVPSVRAVFNPLQVSCHRESVCVHTDGLCVLLHSIQRSGQPETSEYPGISRGAAMSTERQRISRRSRFPCIIQHNRRVTKTAHGERARRTTTTNIASI